MDREQVLWTLRAAVASTDKAVFPKIAGSAHLADIATALEELEPERVRDLLSTLPTRGRAALFGYLDATTQFGVAERFNRGELAELFLHMSSDERADLFKGLNDEQREAFLPALAQLEREDIRKLAFYAEGTIGSVMTSDYATLPPHLSVTEAIEHLRQIAPDAETIYQAYVVDENRKLVGAVSLKDLIVAPPQTLVRELMDRATPFE